MSCLATSKVEWIASSGKRREHGDRTRICTSYNSRIVAVITICEVIMGIMRRTRSETEETRGKSVWRVKC